MLETLNKFVEKSAGKNPVKGQPSKSYGGVGSDIKPGESVDCANLVRSSYKAATGKDLYSMADPKKSYSIAEKNGQLRTNPNGTKSPNGVSVIASTGKEIPLNQVKEGDVLVFGNYSHIATASGNIIKDSNGNTISVSAIGSQTSTGPAPINISMNKSSEWSSDGNNGYWSPLLTTAYRLPDINETSSSSGANITVPTLEEYFNQ